MDTREFKNLIDMEKDVLNHPNFEDSKEKDYLKGILKSEIFSKSEIESLNEAFKIILLDEKVCDDKKADYINNMWKVNYTRKPPSPEEFLTDYWIGPTADSLYPHIKKAFLDFFNPNSLYRNLALYYPIGTGKSLLCSLILLYVSTIVYYLRDYKQFFKLSAATYIVTGVVSLTQDMAIDLTIKPLMNTMSTSTKFYRCTKEDQLLRKVKEDLDTIYYTTATQGNAIFRVGDLHFHVISEPSNMLGLNMINCALVELAFMQEKGMKSETAMRLLTDAKGRVYSRFSNHYLARTIIDSSPNDLNNPVDRYIYYDSIKDPSVLRLMGSKWGLQPNLFPIWEKTGETFSVYLGNSSKAPRIIDKEESLNSDLYKNEEVLDFPIDIKQLAIDGLSKVIKDYGGRPSGTDAKFISNIDLIESMFTLSLKNFYMYEHAPVSLPPEGLLWDIVKKKFFIYSGQGNHYDFYRNPKIERFISIDLAEKHDMAAFAMSHIERNLKNEKVYIVDFSLAIYRTKEDINLDAFKFLILDLVKYGNINIKKVSFDQYQSSSAKQSLIRHDIDVIDFSVDRSPEPYMSFVSYLQTGRVKMGKNLVMKNNLKSLVNSKTPKSGKFKVDHVQGEWIDLLNENWETSQCGYFGKDLSDAVVASIALADSFATDNADFVYNEEKEIIKNDKGGYKSALEEISSKFNLIVNS